MNVRPIRRALSRKTIPDEVISYSNTTLSTYGATNTLPTEPFDYSNNQTGGN